MSNAIMISRWEQPQDALRVSTALCLVKGYTVAPLAARAPRVRTM